MSDSPVVILYGADGYGGYQEKGTVHPFHIDGYGTAGTPKGGVVSVQGVSGGQAIPVSGSVTATNASIGTDNSAKPSSDTLIGGSDGTNLQAARVFDGDTGVGTEWDLGVLVRLPGSGGSVAGGTATNPIRTDPTGTTSQPVTDGGGSLTIDGSVTATVAAVGSDNAAKPSSDILIGGSDGTNLQAARVFDVDSGGGTQYVLGAVLRKSASGGSVELGTASDPIRTDPTGTTSQPVTDGGGSLTVDGSVTANQGTAAALASGWPVKVTDGTNTMPTMDTAARRGYMTVTDGTNSMPTGDAAARGIYERITDGTNTAAVKAASTAAVATDPALVVAISPNNTPVLPNGAATSANQTTLGNQTTKINDGTNTAAVKPASTAAVATDPALVVAISPNNSLTLAGNKTNNNAAPGSNNLGTLPAVANAANPSWTEGNQVGLSVNLAGAMRVTQNAAGSLANWWAVRVTDATNAMPTMDTAARRGYITVTDGTNSMPTGDAAARGIYERITDGTNTAAVKAASTAAVATDPALVVAVSPNNTVATKEIRSGTSAVTSVAAAVADTSLLASNANRLGATVFNDSTATLYLKLGTGASTTSFTVRISTNGYYELPFNYTGAINGYWSAATGNARVTELT